MKSEITPPSHDEEGPVDSSYKSDYLWSAIIAGIIAFLVFLIFTVAGDYSVTNSERIGTVSAFLVLSAGSAVLLAFILNVVGNKKPLWDVRGKLAASLFFVGIFWVWRAGFVADMAKVRAYDAERAKNLKEELARYEELGSEAKPVLAHVRISEEESLKDYLRTLIETVDVVGWSAAKVGGTRWLVKFEYKVGNTGRWAVSRRD